MTDTLRVTRKSDVPVTDPNTGKVTYPSVGIYEGRGRIQSTALQGRNVVVGGADFDISSFTVQLPYNADVRGNDEAVVLTSETDPHMVGRAFRIDMIPRKTHATMLRCGAEEVT